MASLLLCDAATASPGKAPARAGNGSFVSEGVSFRIPAWVRRRRNSFECEEEATPSAPASGGTLPANAVAALIHGHSHEMQSCYDALLASRPHATGKATVRIGISPLGAVGSACLVRSRMESADFDRCLTELPSRWTFPVPMPASRSWVMAEHTYIFNGKRVVDELANVVDPPGPTPAGTHRRHSSLVCEAEESCKDCATADGAALRKAGTLDKDVVRTIIRSHVDEAKACYDAILNRHPTVNGTVKVKFGIASSGAVKTSCVVSSQLADPTVEQCLADLPFAWTFPHPAGGGWVVVEYPFAFTRGD